MKLNMQVLIVLRQTVTAPWHVTNCTLHHHLRIPTVQDVIKQKPTRQISNLADHPNPLLTDNYLLTYVRS
jgi:hypothetical protein